MNKEDAILKGTYEEIVITGIPRKLYIEERLLDSIRLDPENPRFRDILLLGGKSYTDKELEEQIWQEDDTKDLFNAIKASKGLQEQPLITKDGIVKEGNRRIVCLRKLRKLVNVVNDKQVLSIPFGIVSSLFIFSSVYFYLLSFTTYKYLKLSLRVFNTRH